jgi:hypothetical protein
LISFEIISIQIKLIFTLFHIIIKIKKFIETLKHKNISIEKCSEKFKNHSEEVIDFTLRRERNKTGKQTNILYDNVFVYNFFADGNIIHVSN